MTITKKEINGAEFMFVNNSRGNRCGFVHETKLFKNDELIGENKIQYYNRTWECYTYQTVMKSLVSQLKEEIMNDFINSWKTKHEIKRLTTNKREQMMTDFAENPPTDYIELIKLYETL